MSDTKCRTVKSLIPAISASDGAGVRIQRSIGSRPSLRVDPFLMLDEFGSRDAVDYIGGFPPHPHRGFETVTYMLAGNMRHEDHLGNRGDLGPGDVQWMTAGRGIIHSEMPQQKDGLMRGFQLWLNLPATEKMKPASYHDIAAPDIPKLSEKNGLEISIIAGSIEYAGERVEGPASSPTTQPLYLSVRVPAGETFSLALPDTQTAVAYIYEGSAKICNTEVPAQHAAVFGEGECVCIHNTASETLCFLLLAARPLNEPVAQYGPFVMNTHAEIEQTLQDYRDGRLTDTVS